MICYSRKITEEEEKKNKFKTLRKNIYMSVHAEKMKKTRAKIRVLNNDKRKHYLVAKP